MFVQLSISLYIVHRQPTVWDALVLLWESLQISHHPAKETGPDREGKDSSQFPPGEPDWCPEFVCDELKIEVPLTLTPLYSKIRQASFCHCGFSLGDSLLY